MHISQHAEQAVIAVGNKVTIVGGSAAAISGTAKKIGVFEFVGMYGTEISSLCMVGGLVIAFVGYLTSLVFQFRKERRDIRESNWRMSGAPDRREVQR